MTMFRYRVILLDDTIIARDLEKKAVGQVLFDKVCEYLNLLERDYFGLAAWDSSNNKVWLDLSKQVHKQIISPDATFTFSVKFYPPDPSVLAEDITRYLLCLQLRTDILTGRLPCPSDMLTVLGSFVIQSEFGDYNPELHGKEFFSNIPLAPSQTPELEENVTELHRTLKPMSPAKADQLFLENVKTLDLYGVHLHPAKDASGENVMLGVCADVLVVYEDEEKTMSFNWARVLNMTYKRSNFHLRIFDSEDGSENTIKFILPSYRACKCLWRNAVEHHAFFRNRDKAPEGLLRLGSRFRFHGLTQAESLEASSTTKRPAPHFSRSAIKRKAKERSLVDLKRPNRTEVDDWFQVLGSDESWPTTGPVSLQSSQAEEQREELEWKEGTSEKSIRVVKIRKEVQAVTEQHEELEMERNLMRLDVHTDKDKLTGGETLAYKEREEVDEQDNEWFHLLGGRSFHTQHSLSSLSPDTGIMESATLQLWKLQADDWYVLLEPRTYQPTFWTLKNLSLSLQSSQAKEQREELEWIGGTSQKSIKVEAVIEQHEELEMERNLMRPDAVGENLELDIEGNEQILKVMREEIVQDGDGEEIQTVVMYEQRAQEVETYTGQSQKVFVEQRMRGMEGVDTVHELMLKTRQVVSEENIEELEETLLEVESIEQRLQDIERLKFRLQEVEILEQKLAKVQQAGRQRGESDDWYILLEHKLMESSAPARILRVETSEQKLQDIKQKIQEREERGDWYLLLDRKPLLVSSASAEIDIQSSSVHVAEEHINLGKEKKWSEERAIHLRETQTTLPAQREEQTQIPVDNDWFIQQDVSPKEEVFAKAVDVYKETTEEEVQLVEKEVKTITFEVDRREMVETSHEVVQMNPVPFEKRGVPSDTAEQNAEIRRWIEAKLQRANTLTPVQMNDDWHILLESALPLSGATMDTAEQKAEIRRRVEAKLQRANPLTPVQMKDDWYILLELLPRSTQTMQPSLPLSDAAGLRSQQTVTIKEKEVTFDKKPMIIKEKQVIVGGIEKKIPATMHEDEDNWFVLFTPAQIEKKAISTGVSEMWILEEKRLREVQKGRLREDVKKSHVVEDRRLHPSVPGLKAEGRHREVIDDWFLLLEPVSKKSVSVDRRAEEDRRRKEELFKKQTLAEDRKKVAGFKPPSVSVIALTPADQPMTSTPTAQSVRVTRPTYQEESLKRLDITQEITQDITQDSKVETESIIKRKRREKRIEGESIYIRHSILMLEDFDVTQELVLRHHASVSELKRLFMEDLPVFGPTEWDRRLSSYTPVVYPKLPNGELFTGIDIMGADGLLAM
ncbi:protein 4.1b isoform X2 [Ictalurus furcatus]|uniref:protein 4.1b isoform X2 n=1 Tax=Ictalurus furcatus TaxID=66913 RepID=UPI002350390B|nr:protein 4.1b isoform X2 [Ictalurus furcatus]